MASDTDGLNNRYHRQPNRRFTPKNTQVNSRNGASVGSRRWPRVRWRSLLASRRTCCAACSPWWHRRGGRCATCTRVARRATCRTSAASPGWCSSPLRQSPRSPRTSASRRSSRPRTADAPARPDTWRARGACGRRPRIDCEPRCGWWTGDYRGCHGAGWTASQADWDSPDDSSSKWEKGFAVSFVGGLLEGIGDMVKLFDANRWCWLRQTE